MAAKDTVGLFLSETIYHFNKKHYLCTNFCQMKKVYEVAGHKFAVVMPDNNLAWNEMRPYDSFLTEKDGDCVFTAEMVDSLPDTSEKAMAVGGCSYIGSSGQIVLTDRQGLFESAISYSWQHEVFP